MAEENEVAPMPDNTVTMQSPKKDNTTTCEDISVDCKPLQSVEAGNTSQEQLFLSTADQGNSEATALTPQDEAALNKNAIELIVTDDQSNEEAATTKLISEPADHKTRKKRTKALQKIIQDQIEFYFSDSNLMKDRFMKQEIAKHEEEYVLLDVICSFNRMKALCSDRSVVIQAVKRSPLLKLSPDKKMVKRSTPFVPLSQEEVDARTIYVENIPKTDHDGLRKLFGRFGTITYVSLPRYRKTSVLKGFSFIEFSTVESAQKAVEHYQRKNKTASIGQEPLPRSQTNPQKNPDTPATASEDVFMETGDTQSSIGTIETSSNAPTDRPIKRQREERKGDEIEESTKQEGTKCPEAQSPKAKKIKLECADDQHKDGSHTISTETRSDVQSEGSLSNKRSREDSIDTPGETSAKVPRLDSTWSELSAIEEGDEEEGKKKKKTRNHSKKRKDSMPKKINDSNLKVMTKTEWLEIKDLYKKMQKDHMRGVKESNKKDATSPPIKRNPRCLMKCLLKVTCTVDESADEPITSYSLKNLFDRFGPVAFVDYEVGAETGYVRFAVSGCTEKAMKLEDKLANVTFETVTEDEEHAYFLKTTAERNKGFDKRTRKTRGLDKIISRAIKRTTKPLIAPSSQVDHIRFSDNSGDEQ